MEAPQSIQLKFKTALQEFLNDPTTPTNEFYRILQTLKTKAIPPPPLSTTTSFVQETITPNTLQQSHQQTVSNKPLKPVLDENEERKNRMIKSIETRVERKRRDIQEKYRKRM